MSLEPGMKALSSQDPVKNQFNTKIMVILSKQIKPEQIVRQKPAEKHGIYHYQAKSLVDEETGFHFRHITSFHDIFPKIHDHDFYEIFFLTSGKVIHLVNNHATGRTVEDRAYVETYRKIISTSFDFRRSAAV
jgi:hypothetical protein